MSVNTVRVGFIGAGRICRSAHLPGLLALEDVEVIAVCNRSKQSAQKVADDFNIPHIEQDWSKLIARDDLDAVFVCTWPYRHKQFSVGVLEAGKHCFCQARMAMNLAEAKEMFAAAQAHPELVDMISPCPFPMEHYLRHVVQSGQLGQITSVEAISVGGDNLDATKVHWRERAEYSGKQAMAMGILAETLNAMVGPYELLSAQTSIPLATKTDEAGGQVQIGVPQVITITGRLENGALALEHHSGLAVDQTSRGMGLVIRGLEGTLRYNFADTIEFARPGDELEKVDVPPQYSREWTVERDFIEAVRAARQGAPPESRPVRPDFAEGLLYMRKVEAVHQAAATGQAVNPAQL